MTEDDARAYAVFAALSVTPSLEHDEPFERVTQGRQRWPNYSSCGDLCHYVLFTLGCRDSRIVNREDHDAGLAWEGGKNIAKMCDGARRLGCWQPFQLGRCPQPGDLCLIGRYPVEMEHVFVVTAVGDNGEIQSADYGQFDVKTGKHAGTTVTRTLRGDRVYAADGHSREIVGWVDITRVPLSADPFLGAYNTA